MFGGWPALRIPALDFSGHTETCRLTTHCSGRGNSGGAWLMEFPSTKSVVVLSPPLSVGVGHTKGKECNA